LTCSVGKITGSYSISESPKQSLSAVVGASANLLQNSDSPSAPLFDTDENPLQTD
jgi:hypothetical protein